MPYVEMELRDKLASPISTLAESIVEEYPWWADAAGALNYAITCLCLQVMPDQPHYGDLATVVGILETAKLEFYRKLAAPYEDKKCAKNGEVYP